MDIQIYTALGHEVTVSTLQLDFLLPERFDITFTNKDNEEERPVMLHRGLIGTYERFVATLLEQTKGNLPFWLAPKQITVLPVNEKTNLEYAKEINDMLFDLNFRSKLDDREERISKKMREAQMSKSKFILILGDNEQNNRTISYRKYGEKATETVSIDEFILLLTKLRMNYE
ncbi:threonine--tRNA ligase, partial [Mycoplasmopsis pullorum]